jgi:hypothetical protein
VDFVHNQFRLGGGTMVLKARAEGKQLGRPKIAEKTERAVEAALRKKNRPGLRRIAATLGVGVGTVQRISWELG